MLQDIINKINEKFLKEAQNSPQLLEDMAAMEKYMAENYSERVLIELLQNADDAKSKSVKLILHNNLMFFANNGRLFNEADVLAISRSGHSFKKRGKDIGYRGIGFKSTTSITDEILIKILSGKEKIDIQDIGQMRDSILAQCKSKDIYLEYCDYLKRRYNASMPTEDILALN